MILLEYIRIHGLVTGVLVGIENVYIDVTELLYSIYVYLENLLIGKKGEYSVNKQ
jgi:hypothetical protein